MKALFVGIIATVASASLSATTITELDPSKLQYQHNGKKYPPVLFATNISDGFKARMEQFDAFTALDESSVGLPIGVRVIKGLRTKNDGLGGSTGLLAATTLGIIPTVTNKEFKVIYQVFVQGDKIEEFSYTVDSTEVGNLWAMHQEREMKPDEQIFLENTVPHFLNDLTESATAQQYFDEYWEYFE